MKRAILSALTLMSFTSCFAYKITDEKFETTFKNGGVESLPYGSHSNSKFARLGINVPDATGIAFKDNQVDSYHDTYIRNEYGQSVVYEIRLILECDQMHQSYIYHVTLDNNEEYEAETHMFGDVQSGAGVYTIHARTFVPAEYATADATGKMTITK